MDNRHDPIVFATTATITTGDKCDNCRKPIYMELNDGSRIYDYDSGCSTYMSAFCYPFRLPCRNCQKIACINCSVRAPNPWDPGGFIDRKRRSWELPYEEDGNYCPSCGIPFEKQEKLPSFSDLPPEIINHIAYFVFDLRSAFNSAPRASRSEDIISSERKNLYNMAASCKKFYTNIKEECKRITAEKVGMCNFSWKPNFEDPVLSVGDKIKVTVYQAAGVDYTFDLKWLLIRRPILYEYDECLITELRTFDDAEEKTITYIGLKEIKSCGRKRKLGGEILYISIYTNWVHKHYDIYPYVEADDDLCLSDYPQSCHIYKI